MEPLENSHQHRNSTLFTKKHTKGRLNAYNLHVFRMQKKNTKKYILPDKPKFGSGNEVYTRDLLETSTVNFTVG